MSTAVLSTLKRWRREAPSSLFGTLLGKFQEILFRQESVFFRQTIAGSRHFLYYFFTRDEMVFGKSQLSRTVVVIEIDDRDATPGSERRLDIAKIGGSIFEVVVGVADEDQIDGFGGNFRVVRPGQDEFGLELAVHVDEAVFYIFQRLRFDIDHVDLAGRTDRFNEPSCEVAGTCAQVGDVHARFQL